jgi:hypothetical protein
LQQRLFAASVVPSGVFLFDRRVSWVGLELADSISNAVGIGGAVGKYEKDKVRAGGGYFLTEFVA